MRLENSTIDYLKLLQITQSVNIILTNIFIYNNEFNHKSNEISKNKNVLILINDTNNLIMNNIFFENNIFLDS